MKNTFHFILFKAFHAERNLVRQNMRDYGILSPGQPKVLRYVSCNKDCMLKDIAKDCDVEPATVSKILNSLEGQGMLTREVVKNDKRALRLSITQKGYEALQEWNTLCEGVEDQALEGFTKEEKDQFNDYLYRMYFNLSGKNME